MKSENRAETADRLFTELYPPLMKDAHTAFKKAREHPNDYNNRVAFRVAFSAIEGLVYILKDNALAGSHADTSYSPAELALLREEDYQLNDRGIATIRPRFLRIADNLLFAWKMYFRDVLPDFKPDLSGNGWSSFSSSLVIRNRITHPKSGDDLLISVEDLAKLEAGFDWVVQTTFRNMAGAILRMRFRHYEELDRLLPREVQEWLGRLYQRMTRKLDRMRKSVKEIELQSIDADDFIISNLETHKLLLVRGDTYSLTADCVQYLNWRADSHAGRSALNPD